MADLHIRWAAAGVALSTALILSSCADNNAPQPGTPAFFWTSARDTYAAGDYTRTIDNLEKICSSQNDFTARAQPWLLVLTSGSAQGYMELADSFEAGARSNRANAPAFLRQVSNFRGAANRIALQFAENFGAFQKRNKDDSSPRAFPNPPGSFTAVQQLTQIASGAILPAAEIETAQRRALER